VIVDSRKGFYEGPTFRSALASFFKYKEYEQRLNTSLFT